MSDGQDAVLVRRVLDGDTEAFGELLEKYQKPVFNIAYRMLGDADEAKDVAQATFVKAYQSLGRFNSKMRFFSWLYRIAMNEAINLTRTKGRFQGLEESMVASSPRPDESLDRAQNSRLLQSALMGLKPEFRAVLLLRHVSDCSYSEIGTILGIPDKTVKSRLFEARQNLRIVLSKKGVTL